SNWMVLDAAMIKVAVQLHHPTGRELRVLFDKFIGSVPFLYSFFVRTGNTLACRENAERLLREEEAVLLFPEGARGAAKFYRDRHRLLRFGRGGFVRLALRERTPIIPIATLGFEELHPVIANPKWLARLLSIPDVPITPSFPLLGPLGLIPPPVKCFIQFGRPIRFDENPPSGADDDPLVHRLSEKVRLIIQDMFYRMLARRQSVWFG
ncbi:MAG: 1-acyl-sn-glycerol-3-phosphate acyltransferase, partial [Vicinamibacteria bacterium]